MAENFLDEVNEFIDKLMVGQEKEMEADKE